MDWEQLLTPQRLGKQEPEPPESARTCFQRDYDRLIFSSAFRRLKDKTQVFSLVKHDYVRTRLIHSLEVSCVGRSLGTAVGEEIVKQHNLKTVTTSDISDIVAGACIAHDIGNPPFGHSGEDAISAAFASWFANRDGELILSDAESSDLLKFEGNAQGFRILTRLEMYPRTGGMQLTCPTLAAFMKYPRASQVPTEPFKSTGLKKSLKKHGFFQSESSLFSDVAKVLGLTQRSSQYPFWARHPLVFLVEAADDICYSIVDLEDGCRMGFIPFREAYDLLNNIAQRSDAEKQPYSQSESIKRLRAIAINEIVVEAKDIFLQNESKLLNGSFDEDLLSQSKYKEALGKIEEITRSQVFENPEVVSVQVAGYEILDTLFKKFADAVFSPLDKKSSLTIKFLPEEYKPGESDSHYEKILKITDYLSGMTDSYATALFQEFRGISLS